MAETAAKVDLLIKNAVVWDGTALTGDSTVAVGDGKILAVGGSALAAEYLSGDVTVIDAAGGLITPGFADAHNHNAFGGIERNACDLTDCSNAAEALAKIAAYADANPDVEWIVGGGWRMPWFDGGTPLRGQLDEIVPDRPVYLLNADHHGAWANTRALEIAGITAETPDPVDGRIEREADGYPAGTLQEGVTAYITPVLPEYTAEVIRAGILAGEKYLFECGVTAWQEAILGDYGGYPDVTPVYSEMADRGELTGRATGALWVSRDFDQMSIAEYVADLKARRSRYARDNFQLDHIKIMVDGVQENGTAALSDPYLELATDGDGAAGAGETGGAGAVEAGGASAAGKSGGSHDCECAPNTGLAYFSREDLIELVPLLNEAGFDAHFHAIGDRAVKYALDALAAVPAELREQRQNHIAHLHVVDPVDIPRFRELGVRTNIQSLWACQDQMMRELTFPTLGSERIRWQYPFGALAEAGATLVSGSDWPVTTPDPWQAIHVAVNRTEPGEEPGEPLNPEQALTLEQALRAYTHESAKLLRVSGGKIAAGEPADLALTDTNPFANPAEKLWQTKNVLTVVNGRVVYRAA